MINPKLYDKVYRMAPPQEIPVMFMVQGVCPACGDAVASFEKYKIVRWPTTNFLNAVHDQCVEV